MARYRTVQTGSMPASTAFDRLAAFEHVADWDPGVVEARRLDPGPVEVGTGFEVVVRFAGRTLPLEYRVVEIDAPNRVALEARTSTFRSYDVITVEPDGDGCRVTYDAELTLAGVLRVVDPLLHVAFQRVGDHAAAGLRRFLSAVPATR